jgi:hypothetical protein
VRPQAPFRQSFIQARTDLLGGQLTLLSGLRIPAIFAKAPDHQILDQPLAASIQIFGR